jgi:hypothetical protein
MISPEDDFFTPRPMGFGLNENEAQCYFFVITKWPSKKPLFYICAHHEVKNACKPTFDFK